MDLIASPLLGSALLGLCVFVIVYIWLGPFINYVHAKLLAQRDEIVALMEFLFLTPEPQKVFRFLVFLSLAMGGVVFLAVLPHTLPALVLGLSVSVLATRVPKFVLLYIKRARVQKFTQQMLNAMTMMSNGVSAGLSVAQCMECVCANTNGPIAQEFNLVLNKMRLGQSMEEALNGLSERIDTPDVQMFVITVNLLSATGGNMAEIFATTAETLRERRKVEKKIEALTAQGVMQGTIVSLIPLFLLIVFLLLDPNYVKPLFNTTLGWFVLIIIAALEAIGAYTMHKIVSIKV